VFTITTWLKIIRETDLDKAGSNLSPAEQKFIEDAAVAAAPLLKTYLTQIIGATTPRKPLKADVRLNPNDDQVEPKDALVYVTTASLARSFATRNNITLLGGSANGQTAPFAQGVLSEIFIPAIRNKSRNQQEAGVVLANLAIHEIAHNKCAFDPTVADPNAHVHDHGGDGLLAKLVMPAMVRQKGLSPANIAYMAQRIDRAVPQFTTYLLSTKYGF
jgi:hypothetical protein